MVLLMQKYLQMEVKIILLHIEFSTCTVTIKNKVVHGTCNVVSTMNE